MKNTKKVFFNSFHYTIQHTHIHIMSYIVLYKIIENHFKENIVKKRKFEKKLTRIFFYV